MTKGGCGVHPIQAAGVTLLIALSTRSACPSLKIMKPGPGSTPAGAILANGGGDGSANGPNWRSIAWWCSQSMQVSEGSTGTASKLAGLKAPAPAGMKLLMLVQ